MRHVDGWTGRPRSGDLLRARRRAWPHSLGRHPGRYLLALLLGLAITGPGAPSPAQDIPDQITIAFYGPSVFYTDSVARAGFISSVADHVASELGLTVQGLNMSNAADLEGADFAVVDGFYYAGSERGEPVGSARGQDGTAAPLALIVASSGPARLADLRGGTLILPRIGDNLRDFITGQILHGEIQADEFFGDIEYTANIESALSAVSQGRADATLGFAAYGDRSGLRVLGTYGSGPMPVIVQINTGLPDAFADNVADALRGASASGSIRGFGRYDGDAVSSFRRRARGSRSAPTPVMARPRGVTLDPGDIELRDVTEALVVGPPVDLFEPPEMEEP